MEFVQYQTGTDDEGRRLDKVLRILFPDTPLSNFYSCLRKGLIRINEKKVRQDYHISHGDIIYVADFLDFCADSKEKSSVLPIKKDKKTEKTISGIETVFKNEHILVLNKPFDMPVHETSSFKGQTLNQYVTERFTPDSGSLSFTPGPLHRLDRKTTGLVAFSQSIQGARVFTAFLKNHEIKKYYLSIVEGLLPSEQTFTDNLSKDKEKKKADFHTVSISYSKEAKEAITHVKPLASGSINGKTVTLVEVQIETGRMHQIRSQCSSHGYPLAGDSAYGSTIKEGLFLHAWRMEIPYPNALGLPLELSAPLPERFLFFVEKYLPASDLSLYNKKR